MIVLGHDYQVDCTVSDGNRRKKRWLGYLIRTTVSSVRLRNFLQKKLVILVITKT